MKYILTTAILAAATATTAGAATTYYEAVLNDLNGFGASGRVDLRLDDVANRLDVRVRAQGLDPDVPHVQHIHGVIGSDSISPPPSADTDGDGFIELLEGAAFYGPIILSLTDDTVPGLGGFPTAPGGEIDFSYSYDLVGTSAFGAGFGIADLLPLENREVVIHGAFTEFELEDIIGNGLGGGILDDGNGNPNPSTRNYNAGLPVLAGEIVAVPSPIPLPASAFLLMAGLGGLVAAKRRKG